MMSFRGKKYPKVNPSASKYSPRVIPRYKRIEGDEFQNNISTMITATPARHGPSGIEPIAGDVIGFVLSVKGHSNHEIYITGDTVFYEGVAAIAKKFKPEFIFLFAGAARTRGPFNLTMGTNDAIDTAFAFPSASIILLHFEGWKHFTQNENDLEKAFDVIGIRNRLRVLKAGVSEKLF
jgi:L-ascorbate metabolism protein UlaG (beta-lactamase superfamily)